MLEIQHCHTLLGTLLDDRQRRALREVLEELRTRSPSLPNRTALPNVDPRELPDPLAVLRERLEKRGVNRSSFGGPSESIKDKFLKRYSPRGLLGGERGAGKEASGEDTSGGNEGLESDRQEAHE